MKRNIWITVSYEGTAYAGFQRQPVAMTVQKAIEEALLQIIDYTVFRGAY